MPEPTESDSSSFSVRNESAEENEAESPASSGQPETVPPVTNKTTAEVKPTEQPEVETPTPTAPEESLPPQTTAETEAPKEESAPPPITEPPVPTFNIQTWIDYAARYAESIGLNVNPDAVSCWDNPITAGAHSTYLERDIESRLNRYGRDEEITDVWIWSEMRSDGSYDLYIGYA